jgi:plasmid maintenance system killer protein
LQILRRSRSLEDLRSLPSNHLEALSGDRIASGSIASGGFVSRGVMATRTR